MQSVSKALCLLIFALALLAPVLPVPGAIMGPLQWIAAVLLLAHAAELLIAFPYLKRHNGTLVDSIALALLFGLLHWLPLKQRAANDDRV